MSYALSQHGQLAIAGSTGFAQRAPDPLVPMTSEIRSTVASVSKAITAPLVYKLLAENGLTIDAPVTPWLPAAWVKGPGFAGNGVTFRHLLTHTSGLAQAFDALVDAGQNGPWENDWDGLEFVVENGTVPNSPRDYKNANFALLRVIIPELWKAAGGPGGAVTEANVGDRYLQYLHELVLNREGIESITCWPQAGYPEAKSYNFDDPTLAGSSNSSSLDACGGHANLHFSAQELTRYAAAFRYNDVIMSPSDRTTMRDELAGWNGASAVDGGTAYSHGGSWNKTGSRYTRTCVMELPHGVNASIVINSMPPLDKCTVLRDAFDAAMPD
jgi:CubicO group peptidase (beta-lactamase class C family)